MGDIEITAANPQSTIGHHRINLRDAGYHLPNSGLNRWSERLFQSQFLGSVRLQRWRGQRSWAGDSMSCSADRRCLRDMQRKRSNAIRRSKARSPQSLVKKSWRGTAYDCGHGRKISVSAIARPKHLHTSRRLARLPMSNDRVARLPIGCGFGLAG
jgi:hypothetical protein